MKMCVEPMKLAVQLSIWFKECLCSVSFSLSLSFSFSLSLSLSPSLNPGPDQSGLSSQWP